MHLMVRDKKKLVYIHVKAFTSPIIKFISESEYENLMILKNDCRWSISSCSYSFIGKNIKHLPVYSKECSGLYMWPIVLVIIHKSDHHTHNKGYFGFRVLIKSCFV